MTDNTVVALVCVLRICCGAFMTYLGVTILRHGHSFAGGWMIIGGFVLAAISVSVSRSEEEG